MPSLSEGKYAAEFLEAEADGDLSRENAIVLSGENLKAGHVIGRKLIAPTFGAATALGTNTGNGVFGAVTMGTNAGARRGTYRVVIIEPGANVGTFAVFGPDGIVMGQGVVATLFNNEVQFTLADGATDFVSGDEFQFTVTGGTYKLREYNPANTDGTQRPAGISYGNYDATAGDIPGAYFARLAVVSSADLTWFSGATQAQKDFATDQLATLNQIVAR